MEETRLEHLPQDCISHVLSFTSPRDVHYSSLVSSAIRDASESDVLWENFLPSNYREIISRLVSPMVFTSTKELFHKFSSPLLVDGGKKAIYLDKSTGKICYKLSARELQFTWANSTLNWCWKPLPQSRFDEVAKLVMTHWLEIHGQMNNKSLSPNTTYEAYLIVKIASRAYGLDSLPLEVSIQVGEYHSLATIYLPCRDDVNQSLKSFSTIKNANEEEDKWMEIGLGEFYNDGSDKMVKMSLKDIEGEHLKGGLIVEGIELRPK